MRKVEPLKMMKRQRKAVPKPMRISVNNQINSQRYSSPYANPQVDFSVEAVRGGHTIAKPSHRSTARSHTGATRTSKPQAFHDASSGLHCTPLITEKEAAGILRVHPKTLAAWRRTKRYDLPVVRFGRLVRYRLAGIEALIDAHS